MNITVVWIIIAICTITFCIGLFKATSDIEKDLVEESFFDIKKDIEYLKAKIEDIRYLQTEMNDIEKRLNKMQIENLIVRDDIPVHKEKDDEYYDGLLEWMDDNKED